MACPYFYPLEPTPLGDPHHAMLPLGNLWRGECRVTPANPARPDDASLRPLCNLGYARETCPRFPASPDGPDAVRFTIARDHGSHLQLYYVIERDHHPFAHGPLEYAAGAATLASPPAGETFQRQAVAYAESYLSRKNEAPGRQPASH